MFSENPIWLRDVQLHSHLRHNQTIASVKMPCLFKKDKSSKRHNSGGGAYTQIMGLCYISHHRILFDLIIQTFPTPTASTAEDWSETSRRQRVTIGDQTDTCRPHRWPQTQQSLNVTDSRGRFIPSNHVPDKEKASASFTREHWTAAVLGLQRIQSGHFCQTVLRSCPWCQGGVDSHHIKQVSCDRYELLQGSKKGSLGFSEVAHKFNTVGDNWPRDERSGSTRLEGAFCFSNEFLPSRCKGFCQTHALFCFFSPSAEAEQKTPSRRRTSITAD